VRDEVIYKIMEKEGRKLLWWKNLEKVCEMETHNNCFLERVEIRVGEDNHISSWYHRWKGDMTLAKAYLKVYLNLELKAVKT